MMHVREGFCMYIQLTISIGCGQCHRWDISTGDIMCGRYSIYESMDHYLKELAPKQLVIKGYDIWPLSDTTAHRRPEWKSSALLRTG